MYFSTNNKNCTYIIIILLNNKIVFSKSHKLIEKISAMRQIYYPRYCEFSISLRLVDQK